MMVAPFLSGAGASHSKFSTYAETIGCYECKSTSHKSCRDPFNGTANVFPLEPCKGCCVKIVRHYNTEKESIWRTCTEKLEISNSLVHRDVCMDESNGQGHLCICSEDKCNAAASFPRPGFESASSPSSLLLLLLLTAFLSRILLLP
ncbi:putative Protein quiver [Hypsibius exemplaris]|uniref:UPAR/Ly6 domain-containing protein qvr n=1 Tax=Hypsibius exemplaris TaxID=2072580 RepID=A0A1W0X3H7_HYPEX|nr:putative Protein quiver [Hypsibius exemplaris]